MFVKIVDDCRAYFLAAGVTATVDDGYEARARQSNFGPGTANRVVFEPDEPIEVGAPIAMGWNDSNTRELFNAVFLFRVYFAGFDPDANGRDLVHRHVCFDLWEKTAQSVQLSYAGVSEWRGAKWNLEKRHIVHGAELVASLALHIPIYDAASASAIAAPIPGAPKPVTP